MTIARRHAAGAQHGDQQVVLVEAVAGRAPERLGAPLPADVLAALHAADFDEALLETALAQMLLDWRTTLDASERVSPVFGSVVAERKPALLWEMVRNKLLVPRATLARSYGLAPYDWRVPLFYVRRALDC